MIYHFQHPTHTTSTEDPSAFPILFNCRTQSTMPLSTKESEACHATILRAFNDYRAASDEAATNFSSAVVQEMARIAKTLAEATVAQDSATDTGKSDGRGQHVQRPLLSGQRNASVEVRMLPVSRLPLTNESRRTIEYC